MSTSKPLLHGDGLLHVLTGAALEVQRAPSPTAVFEVACRELERLGFWVAIIGTDGEGYSLRQVSDRPVLSDLARLIFNGASVRLGAEGHDVFDAMMGELPLLIEDLRGAARGFVQTMRPESGFDFSLMQELPAVGVVAPLDVRRSHWGALVLLHDELGERDLGIIRLFALQLGSAIEVCDGFDRLERRTAELGLVHELAVAGPTADSKELCLRALETVCRTTRSDCGVLHRYDSSTDLYTLVSEPYGYSGPMLEQYRSFRIDPSSSRRLEPLALPTAQLPVSSHLALSEGLQHMAVVPLVVQGEVAGLLTLARRQPRPYEPGDVRSAEILGVQMVGQLERARLYEEAQRLYADLKRSYDELARTQQELVRHERLAALGELAAVMAHEVRNPLGVIFNSLSTLKRLLRPAGDAEMLLNMVGEEADRLNRIVADLLDFVRPFEIAAKPLPLEPLVTSAVDSVLQTASSANVKVVTELSPSLPPFPIDGHTFKQALVNLLVNAAQAMPRGGTVVVEVELESKALGSWLVVRVKDQGVGLSERVSAKLFQPFFTTKASGTGLGLAVVKRIVDAHQGEVQAKANPEGGTTFTMRFPPERLARGG